VDRLFRFEARQIDGVYQYVSRAQDAEIPDPLWPGLMDTYSDDRRVNPWWRYGINNADGEALAVWRALAWAVTAGTDRWAVPSYYRDEAADHLDRPRDDPSLVSWEYCVDTSKPTFEAADLGYVRARTAALAVGPDEWSGADRGRAGLFHLFTFDELTALDRAVGFDASSEIVLYGLGDRAAGPDRLAALLDRPHRPPTVGEILGPLDLFVDLSIVRDRFLGHFSYLTIRSRSDIAATLSSLVEHYESAFQAYARGVSSLMTFEDFCVAIDELLAVPPW
jgi:hypothetical protein